MNVRVSTAKTCVSTPEEGEAHLNMPKEKQKWFTRFRVLEVFKKYIFQQAHGGTYLNVTSSLAYSHTM